MKSGPDAERRTNHRRHADGERPFDRQYLVTMKAEHRAHVLSEHPYAVRTVRDAGWKAEKDQQRQRQKRASAGEDVDHGGDEADEEKGEEAEPRHGVSLSRRQVWRVHQASSCSYP